MMKKVIPVNFLVICLCSLEISGNFSKTAVITLSINLVNVNVHVFYSDHVGT